MDTTTLRSAYASLIGEARQGGFGEPPEGEWNADQIIAHVAANDELLATTTRQVLDGAITRLDRPLPWPAVLRTQAEMHLPRHLDQLRALRA